MSSLEKRPTSVYWQDKQKLDFIPNTCLKTVDMRSSDGLDLVSDSSTSVSANQQCPISGWGAEWPHGKGG